MLNRFKHSSTRLTPLGTAIALALCAPLAIANTTDGTPSPQQLDKIRVIGTADDPQTSTGSAYVLNERELRKFTATNANDVLRTVPGVYTREENALGFFPRVSVRASTAGRSNRISLLEDGLPTQMAPYANTSAYFFPTIGRMHAVEVLKGAEILLHGPQTTSGVVNLVSTPIPAERQGQYLVELGSFNNRLLHASYGDNYGQFGWLVETWQSATDGPLQIDRSSRHAGSRNNDSLAKFRWQSADASQQLELKLHYQEETGNVSYLGLTDADFAADPNRRYGLGELEQMNRGRKAANLRHQIDFNDRISLNSAAYWMRTHRIYDRLNQVNGVALGQITNRIQTGHADAALLQGILDGTADTTHANGVRYGHNHQAFEAFGLQTELNAQFDTGTISHDISAGVRYHEDITRNGVRGISNSIYQQINGELVYQSTQTTSPSKGDAKAWALWAADSIRIGDNLTVMPIVRHERIRTRANLAANATDAQIAARAHNSLNKTTAGIGVNYAINPSWTLLGGVHQGFAPPGNGAVNGTHGEESINIEAGARFRHDRFGVDAIGFHTNYTNSIRTCMVANPCPGGAIDGTEQTGRKKVYGLELGAFADLYRGDSVTVPLRTALTFTDGEYTRSSDTGNVLKGDVIEYTPKFTGTVQVGLETARSRNYLAVNYTDDSWTDNSAGRQGVDNRLMRTQSLLTVNLSTHHDLSPNAEVFARLDNVFDQQRITHRGADGARGNAPRSLTIGIRGKF